MTHKTPDKEKPMTQNVAEFEDAAEYGGSQLGIDEINEKLKKKLKKTKKEKK